MVLPKMVGELEKRIKKRASEISSLDKDIRALQSQLKDLEAKKMACRAVIDELENLIRSMPKDGSAAPVEKTIRFGSDVYKAREVLTQERQPLHIKELLEKMGLEPTRNRRSSLSSQLSTYARKDEIFSKAGPNTFGLIDYGPEPSEQERDEILTNAVDDWAEPVIADDDIPF